MKRVYLAGDRANTEWTDAATRALTAAGLEGDYVEPGDLERRPFASVTCDYVICADALLVRWCPACDDLTRLCVAAARACRMPVCWIICGRTPPNQEREACFYSNPDAEESFRCAARWLAERLKEGAP